MNTNKCINILNNYFASVGEKIQSDNEMPDKINSILIIPSRDNLNKGNLDHIDIYRSYIYSKLLIAN